MTAIIYFFGKNWKVAGIFPSLPLEWYNPADVTYSPILLRSTDVRRKQRLSTKMVLLAITLLILLIQAIWQGKFEKAKQDASQALTTWLSLALFLAFIIDTFICYTKGPEIAEMVNGFIQFDHIHNKKPTKSWKSLSLEEMLTAVMAAAVILTQISLPLGFVFGLHWQNPWKASIAGYWLITKADSFKGMDGMFHALTRVIILAANYWIWAIVINGPCFAAGVLHTLCSATLTNNINLFRESITHICGNRQRLTNSAALFRHIQVLNVLLNEVQKGALIVVLIWSSTFILSLALSMLVLSSVNADLTSLATLMLIAVDCTLEILIILGGMSKVYKASRIALASKPELCSRSDQRWLKRFFGSCHPLKIRALTSYCWKEVSKIETFRNNYGRIIRTDGQLLEYTLRWSKL